MATLPVAIGHEEEARQKRRERRATHWTTDETTREAHCRLFGFWKNAIYDEFVAQYRQNIQELSDRYNGIVEAQEQWRENWLRSVGMLQAQQEEQ